MPAKHISTPRDLDAACLALNEWFIDQGFSDRDAFLIMGNLANRIIRKASLSLTRYSLRQIIISAIIDP